MSVSQHALVFINHSVNKEVESLLENITTDEMTIEYLNLNDAPDIENIAKQIVKADLCFVYLSSFGKEESEKMQNFTEFPEDSICISNSLSNETILLVRGRKAMEQLAEIGRACVTLDEEGHKKELKHQIKWYGKRSPQDQEGDERAQNISLRTLWVMEAYAEEGEYVYAYKIFCEVHKINQERKGESIFGRSYDEIEKMYSEIIHQNQNQNKNNEEILETYRYYWKLACVSKIQRKYTYAKLKYREAITYVQGIQNLDWEEEVLLLLQYALAELHTELGEYKDAERLYREVAEKSKKTNLTDSNVAYNIALTQLGQERYDLAKNNLKRLYVESKESGDIKTEILTLEELGDLYYDLGDFGKAEEKYREILNIKRDATRDLERVHYVMYKLLLVYSHDRTKEKEMEEMFDQIQDELFEKMRESEIQKYREQELTRLSQIEDAMSHEKAPFKIGEITQELGSMINSPHRNENEMSRIRKLLEKILYLAVARDREEYRYEYQYDYEISDYSVIYAAWIYLAKSYQIRGNFKEAEMVYETLKLNLDKKIYERYDGDLRLADMYRAQGRLLDAEVIARKNIAWNLERKKEDPHKEMRLSIQLINVYLKNKKYSEVNKLCREKQEGMELETRVSSVIIELEHLSFLSKLHQKRYKEIIVSYEKRESLLSSDFSLESFELKYVLASAYQALQRYSKAKRLLDENWKMLESIRGESFYEDYVDDLNVRYVKFYASQEKWAIAQRKCEKILRSIDPPKYRGHRGYRDDRGLSNSYLNTVLYTLAEIYNAQGRCGDAEKLHKRALESSKRILGQKHPETIIGYRKLATLYLDRDNKESFEKAKKTLKEALRLSEKDFGEDHEEILRLKYNLALVYGAGEGSMAEELLKEIIGLSKDSNRGGYPDTLQFTNGLANLYVKRKNIEEAKDLFKEVLKQKTRLGNKHPVIREAERGLEGISISPIESESQSSSEQCMPLDSIVNQLADQFIWYYEKVKDNKYMIKVFRGLLKKGKQYGNYYENKLKLAEIYYKEERFRRVVELYANDELTEDIKKFDDETIIFRTLELISKSYLNLKHQRIDLDEFDRYIETAIRETELHFGCTNFRDIREIKQIINKKYILERDYIRFALKQNNESINSQLVVKNFLDIKEFNAKITPLTCLFGDNRAGKTVIMKILYACQNWAYKKTKDTTGGVKASKDMFLQKMYEEGWEEEGSSEKKYKEGIAIHLLNERINFFEEKLKEMIKLQIQSITNYIDREKSVKDVWSEISTIGGSKEPVSISGKNLFFESTVSYNEMTEDLQVELRWEGIEQIIVRVKRQGVQLQIDGKDEEGIPFILYYYIFKNANFRIPMASIAPDLPIYAYASTVFVVNDMTERNIELCILNILFNCTPFVFFEGSAFLFPGHRTGTSIFLPIISSDILSHSSTFGATEYVSQEDREIISDVVFMNGTGNRDWRMERIYENENSFADIFPYYETYPPDSPYIYSLSEIQGSQAIMRLGIDLLSEFSKVENERVEVISKGGGAVEMLFYRENGHKDFSKKTARKVAASTLSLSFLNLYITKLEKIFTWIKDLYDNRKLHKRWEEEIIEIMKYRGFSQVLLYDEPENSLYPEKVIKMIQFLFEMYKRLRNVGIPWSLFCITHSPRVMRFFLYEVIGTFGNDIKKIREHYSPIKFTFDPESELYTGEQIEIEDDLEYKEYPFTDVNEEEYRIREEIMSKLHKERMSNGE